MVILSRPTSRIKEYTSKILRSLTIVKSRLGWNHKGRSWRKKGEEGDVKNNEKKYQKKKIYSSHCQVFLYLPVSLRPEGKTVWDYKEKWRLKTELSSCPL